MILRRWVALPFLAVFVSTTALAQSNSLEVVLVGTGGPELTASRRGPATLITAGASGPFLFDAGRGVLDGLFSSGIAPQRVAKIFLTHLHNDHIEGLPPLWITPWFLLGRQEPLEVWGPPGTTAMVDGMRAMFAHDLDHRANARLRHEYLDIRVHEIEPEKIKQDTEVYRDASVTIQAFPAQHDDGNPALSYRLEAGGRSVLLTGDTTLSDTLLAAAEGADVVIANVVAGTSTIEAGGAIDPILAKLLRPEQAALLFLRSKARLGVFSHIVKKGLPGSNGDASVLARTRAAGYAGPLVMGLDGMRILVGEEIRTLAPAQPPTDDLDGVGILF